MRFRQLEMKKEFLGKRPCLEPWSAEAITVRGRESQKLLYNWKGFEHQARVSVTSLKDNIGNRRHFGMVGSVLDCKEEKERVLEDRGRSYLYQDTDMGWTERIIWVEVALWAGKEEWWVRGNSQTRDMTGTATERGSKVACRLKQSIR